MKASQFEGIPPLPRDTARAAEAAFGKGNIYLTIGDHFKQLLTEIDFDRLVATSPQSVSTLAVYALVTIFQFVEGLPDRRAGEAIRTRTDWKYALHLSLANPGLDHLTLCRFRQLVLSDPAVREVFQQMIRGLTQLGFLRDAFGQNAVSGEILAAVCARSRLEQLIEVMRAALESLAAVNPKWLVANTLPHWYERYNQQLAFDVLPGTIDAQNSLALSIGQDARHLLEAVLLDDELAQLPEVQALQRSWPQQFNRDQSEIEWRMPVCTSCLAYDRSANDLAHHS